MYSFATGADNFFGYLSTNGVMSDKSLDCDGLEARLYNIGDVFMHEWVKWQASAPFS